MADRLTPDEATTILEATLDATRDGIVVVDSRHRILRYNRRYLQMFGFTGEQLEQGGLEFVVATLAAQIEGYTELLARVDAFWTDPQTNIVDTMRFNDGRVYERFVSACRIGADVIGLVASFRDVTHSEETERALEQHRAFLEKAQEVAHIGSWVSELDGSERLVWSREAYRIFGIGRDEFSGSTEAFFTRVHPADRDGVRHASAAARAGDHPYDLEHRIVRPDGTIRWVHEKADVLRDQEGRPFRLIGTVQDITDRRLLEDQLRQAQKMEAIGRLAGGIAHDLNNALTAIAGYAELALGQIPAADPVRADVQEIRRGAERAGSVTRQLLAFSRRELLEPRLFDLNQTVTSMGRLLARLLGADIQVRTEVAPRLPTILGDPGQIEQAVINLAVNARDAMPNGGRLVLATSAELLGDAEARANVPMPPGKYVVLRVTDTGHGMSRETQAHIFEPFFTTKETGKGTGLGLSMVYGTLKQIGGYIFVDSEVGRGTTFRLYFRPAAAKVESPPLEMENGDASAVRASGASQQTILVVEDEPAVRNLVASSLRADGYRLLLAGSAEEALQVVGSTSEQIDLLLTDAIMPGKSGIELAHLLTAKRPGIRVVVMSGYTEETLAGLDDRIELLQKPFAPRDLRQRIREALDQIREKSS